MKRILLFSSVAIIAMASCAKQETADDLAVSKSIVLGANIEQPTVDTKATLDGSLNTLWATGDKIKVYIANGANDWYDDIDFTLSSGNGTSSGTFKTDDEFSATDHWDNYAFFPYYYTTSGGAGNTGSNMGGDGFYFNLPDAYYNYTSGQSFIPLIANMSGGSTHPTSIDFKFVGGAVDVNLNKVPGAAKSLGLSVEGKNITGWPGKVLVANAGTDYITASNGSNSTVTLYIDSSGTEDRSFKFIYPVPVISTTSNLTFTMSDKNGLKIWEKTASSQPAIGRAKALVMPTKDVAPMPQNMYLVGYWDSADQTTGVAFDNATGTLTKTFSGDAYVCLRAADIGKWYMTDTYVGSGYTALLKCQSGEKLYVPAGTWKFTMTYNSAGTITLTYEDAS